MAWWKGERKEARLLPLPSSHCPMSAFCCLIIGIPVGKLCGGESCYVPTLYVCNDRNVMVNFKPGDYLPEWGRCVSVSDTGGSEEKNLYHQVCCTLQLARTLFPILANWWEKVMFPALRIFPTPFNFVLFLQFKVISCAFHKHDKFGHPCYIEHTGRTDITALLKVSLTSLLFPFYIFCWIIANTLFSVMVICPSNLVYR